MNMRFRYMSDAQIILFGYVDVSIHVAFCVNDDSFSGFLAAK
jgi:hypothetical protein